MNPDTFLEKLRRWVRRDFASNSEASEAFNLGHKNYLPDILAGRRKVPNSILSHYGYSLVVSKRYVKNG